MHISLPPDTHQRLKAFAKERKRPMTGMIDYALRRMFETEEVDNKREEALKRVLDRKFAMPAGFTAHNFLTCLYMLSARYPNMDAKAYWGSLFRSTFTKTHERVFKEVEEEWKIELGEKK